MEEKKSIRNLNIENPRGGSVRHRDPLARERAPRGFNMMYLWVIGLIVAVIGIGIAVLALVFPETKVIVTPQKASLTLNSSHFTASRDRSAEGFHFDVASLSAHDSVTAPAQGTKKVSETAVGTIQIKNLYSSTSTRLIKNTRFQSQAGKIYRIRESVVIPGYTTKGDAKVAGTLTVKVYADVPGAEYNLSEGSFTVPGLKDKTDMFEGVTATLVEPIRGGYVGDRPVVSDADLKSAEASLKSRLAATVTADIAQKLPSGSVTLKELTKFTYSDIKSELQENTATLSMDVTADAVTFDQQEFSRAIAQELQPSLAAYPARFDLGSVLSATPDTTEPFGDTLSFSVSGTAQLVWDIDTQKIANALVGASVSDVQARLAAFPEIKTAEAQLRPFWRSTFPSDAKDITVEVPTK